MNKSKTYQNPKQSREQIQEGVEKVAEDIMMNKSDFRKSKLTQNQYISQIQMPSCKRMMNKS